MWVFTVLSPIRSSVAISLLTVLLAISWSTSTSRGERISSWAGARESKRLIQKRDGVGLGPNILRWEKLEEIQQDRLDDVQATLSEVGQLEANVESIRADLDQLRTEITRLENGPDPLERQELEANVESPAISSLRRFSLGRFLPRPRHLLLGK